MLQLNDTILKNGSTITIKNVKKTPNKSKKNVASMKEGRCKENNTNHW